MTSDEKEQKLSRGRRRIRIALAGNSNVGKSLIFNQLTGLHQHIGNWPGKTVERAEGTLFFKGYTIDIIDLPGIYSLSAFSIEELVSREYIINEMPDLVINVVDATLLERNLFFTLQLLELGAPLIVALNQIDLAKRKGIEIDVEKLAEALGVPVVPTVAVKGVGLYELLERAIEIIEKRKEGKREHDKTRNERSLTNSAQTLGTCSILVRYGNEIEERIGKLVKSLSHHSSKYPPRYAAINLLEGDAEIKKEINKMDPSLTRKASELAGEIERLHNHSCVTVIASERYEAAGSIARRAQEIKAPVKPLLEERLHSITTNKILGYPIMLAILLSMFYSVFSFGGWLSALLTNLFYSWQAVFVTVFGTSVVPTLVWSVIEGITAGLTVVLPYVIPFYLILYVLENSGYLSRVAFLMDSVMHKMGLHGKAFIPMMLGYGCNVPACLGCRIMETERERTLAAFVTTLVPCAARTVVILGLVGYFVGVQWALGLYLLNLAVIFILGRIAFKALPGEPTALIMEMADYKLPHMKTVIKETYFRVWEFVKMAFPIIIAGSFVLKLLDVAGLMQEIGAVLSPVTVLWLGLPAVAGVALIFGVLRKELTLVMLSALLGTTNFALVMTPIQMIVFTIVVLFYVPCIATIGALVKELGWKKASYITLFEILFAITIGGIAARILTPLF
jgi:ferrous iron transport protein B